MENRDKVKGTNSANYGVIPTADHERSPRGRNETLRTIRNSQWQLPLKLSFKERHQKFRGKLTQEPTSDTSLVVLKT
jgi:hypothetical protein